MLRPSLVLALISFAFHLFVNGRYGFFRDELYFIICGQRPDWGYVDQPPLIPLAAAGSYWLFGKALVGFRLLPALVMSATVALTAEFTAALGGGRFAQTLAGLCVLGAGFFLATGLLFSTDMFQPLSWLALGWLLVRIAQTGEERWWLAIGAVVGISLLSKYTIAFYLMALVPGILFSALRRSFARPWIYAGAGLALVMVLPNILWQQQQGWPFLEIGAAGSSGKNIPLTPLNFFVQQLLFIGPLAAPVWLSGLWVTAVKPADATWRIFPIAYAILFTLFVATHGKPYYLAAIYPTLLGFGAVAWERWLAAKQAQAAALGIVALVAIATSPLAVPVLSPQGYTAYAAMLGMGPSTAALERAKLGALPQQFADMFGWPEMAAKVSAVYRALPPDEQAQAVFFGQNYGEAAAIDIFGQGLPPAISSHNNYYFWGPRGHDGSVMIVIGGDLKQMRSLFASVTQVDVTDAPYAMPYETGQPIYVLRGLKEPMAVLWPSLKRYR